MKLFEIGYPGTYHTDICTVEELHFYHNHLDGFVVGEITSCQTCGKETADLEIVKSLARCTECENQHHKTMERADQYMNAPWNPFDNDYEEGC